MTLGVIVASAAIFAAQVSEPADVSSQSPPTLEASSDVDQRAESARQLLAVLGIDDEKLGRFQDGMPVSEEESEMIGQLVRHVARFDPIDVERWSRKSPSIDEFERAPLSHRAEFLRFDGHVHRVDTIEVGAEADSSRQELYRVAIDAPSTARRAVVWCRRIPRVWRQLVNDSAPFDFPASVRGLFLKRFEADGVVHFVCVADRISWFPDRPAEAANIAADQVFLASYGMDIGLFDELVHKRRLVAEDRECFYQLLAAIGRSDATAASHLARTQFDIVKLLDAPSEESSRAYQFIGTARRAVCVVVHDPDIRQRFGIDHYYELDVFVPLPTTLNLVDLQTDQSVSYSSYPMTFCVPRLPAGMEEGSDINQPVQVLGFYLKLWAFRKQSTEESSDDSNEARQVDMQFCPLFIGYEPVPIATGIRGNRRWELMAGVAFVLAILAAVYWLRRQHRQDVAFARRHQPDTKVDLSFLDRQ
jgi:hypothetical protein